MLLSVRVSGRACVGKVCIGRVSFALHKQPRGAQDGAALSIYDYESEASDMICNGLATWSNQLVVGGVVGTPDKSTSSHCGLCFVIAQQRTYRTRLQGVVFRASSPPPTHAESAD